MHNYIYKTAGWETTPLCVSTVVGFAVAWLQRVAAPPCLSCVFLWRASRACVLELSLLNEKSAAYDFDMFAMIENDGKRVCGIPFGLGPFTSSSISILLGHTMHPTTSIGNIITTQSQA